MNTRDTRYHQLTSIRLSLALLVAWSHAFPLTGHPEPLATTFNLLTGGTLAVVMFFFISGALITLSWQKKNSVTDFTIARFFRIWPGLGAALLLSALLASITSEAPPLERLISSIHYIAHNIPLVSGIEYEIIGAFAANPLRGVNGSLWTLPWEVYCYVALAAFGVTGLLRTPLVTTTLVACCLAGIVFITYARPGGLHLLPEAAMVMFAFGLGILCQVNLPRFGAWRMSAVYLATALLIWLIAPELKYVVMILVLCAVMILLAFSNRLPAGDLRHDLSYGVYIYAFPVQQTAVWLFPDQSPILNMTLSLPVTVLLSWLSWQHIERPCIKAGQNIMKRRRQTEKVQAGI